MQRISKHWYLCLTSYRNNVIITNIMTFFHLWHKIYYHVILMIANTQKVQAADEYTAVTLVRNTHFKHANSLFQPECIKKRYLKYTLHK